MIDNEMIDSMYEEYVLLIYRYILRLCHDEMLAQDITADVFLEVMEQVSRGKGPKTNIRSYLYQCAYHRIIDHSRYQRRFAPLEIAETVVAASELHEVNGSTSIMALVSKLPVNQRAVLYMRFVEDRSMEQTAQAFGKSISWVKVNQNRAITNMRRLLARQRKLL